MKTQIEIERALIQRLSKREQEKTIRILSSPYFEAWKSMTEVIP